MVKANVSGIHVSAGAPTACCLSKTAGRKLRGAMRDCPVGRGIRFPAHPPPFRFRPSEDLKQMNIHPVCDLKSVGHNLQDHFTVSLIFRCSRKNHAERSIERARPKSHRLAEIPYGTERAVFANRCERCCASSNRPGVRFTQHTTQSCAVERIEHRKAAIPSG